MVPTTDDTGDLEGDELRLSAGAALRVVLLRSIWVLLSVVLICSLALHGETRTLVVDGLGMLAVWMAAAVCWLGVLRFGSQDRRPEVVLAALAATSYVVGVTIFAATVMSHGEILPFPWLGDVVGLSFYPLMLAAVAVAVRRHSRGLVSSVWLDGAVGSLGAAAVLAVLLSSVLDSALQGPPSLRTALSIAYPVFDLVLVAAVAGVIASGGIRLGGRWGLLGAGLTLFAAADVIYALQQIEGRFVAGTSLDAGWGIGLALVAMWVDGVARQDGSEVHQVSRPTGATALVGSAVATAAGLGVLVVSSQKQLSDLAVALAAVTLLAAAARTQVAFRQLVRMADLRRQATTDYLTGLPNRRALYAQADVRMAGLQPGRQALLLLDLDRFKEVNDSLGHQLGDQLLIQVGARLREHLRPGDLLVRLGGDEFAALLDDAGRDQAERVAVKLCAVLTQPFTLEDIAVHSSVSIGIALFPDDGADLNTLLRKADVAMYKAKSSAEGHHVYGGADDTDISTRLQTVDELRTALTHDQLLVYYQPKIDLHTGEVHAVEALVRWDHPTRGLLYPDAFLDLVEDAGLMRALTRAVLNIALDQAVIWSASQVRLTVAVNLSPSFLVDTDLPDEIASMLAARNLSPGALQLEITEDLLMADRDRARSILTRLRRHGVQIAIDDYGTGYSSLSYLRDLPLDELKLDRSFIFPMADDAHAAALVESTIALAHGLGLRMVAEGVENEATYTELARLGCDQAQGYFISRPVPAGELEHWLSTWRAPDTHSVITPPIPSAASG